ncbi:beta strand repeat-containing protein [Arthrobacter sp. Z4-13]
MFSVLSALIVSGLAPANAVDLSDASISGKLTAPAGVNLASTQVYAYTSDSYSWAGSGQVNDDGTYAVSGLPAGAYKIQFNGSNGAGTIDQWYSGATSHQTATPVTLGAGQSLTGINATLVKGASIGGKVTAPSGVDLTRVYVSVESTGTDWYRGSGSVNPDGSYAVRGLPSGTYKVEFSDGGSGAVTQWHAGAASRDTATPVTLTAGQDVTGINATLVRGASINGTVTVPAGIDASTLQATVYEAAGTRANYVTSASVNTDGTYKVTGLRSGSYKIQFLGWETGLLEQWYSAASSFEAATPVAVTEGQDQSGVNASLIKGASISGKVTSAAGVDLGRVQAYLFRADGISYVTSRQVSADGSFTFGGLVAGSYKVQFSAGSSGALSQWYGGAASSAEGTAVDVTSSQELALTDTVLVKGASIGGTVTAPAGVALTAVWVYAYNADNFRAYPASTMVQADGTYKLTGLAQGNYVLQFSGSNSGALDLWHSNGTSRETATPLSLAAGQDVSGVNTTLVKGATISGKVTVPAGVSLSGVSVRATSEGTPFTTSASLNADGTYTVRGLPAGTYKVQFANYNSGALDEWYNNVLTQAAATPVVLAAGQDKTAVDATLAVGAAISGKVTLPAGVSSYSVQVSVFKAADNTPVTSVQLSSDGTYTLRGLPAGSYKLQFGGHGSGALTQWYNKATSLATATPLTLTEGQSATAINATLVKGGAISGKITAPAGTSLYASQIIATKTGAVDAQSVYGNIVWDGTYSIVGLETGTYKVRFLGGQSGAEDRWYGGATVETAKAVAISAGQSVTGADIEFVTGATISGKVTGSGTSGYYPLSILDGSGKLVKSGSTDGTGNYSVVGLAAGSYKVAFNRSSGFTQDEAQYYQNQPESAGAGQAKAIPLTSGQSAQNIDATLTAGGSVTGTVLDKAGKPAANAFIQAYTPDGSLVTRSVSTDAAGNYTLKGLTTGNYTLRVHSGTSGRGDLYSGNVTTEASATKVSVVRGKATTHNLSYALGVQNLTAPTPTVKGTAKVGYALTATVGTWGPAPVTLKYQWKANGVAITGATATTFKPMSAQVGKTLTFTATGTKTGYTTATKTSTATGTVMALNPVLTAPTPKITGTAKVGYTLSAVPGTWGPAPVTLKYQWKANGIAVTGATAATFKATAAQLGKTLTVTVTGSKAGYNTAAKTSALTTKVAVGTLAVAVPKITGTARVGYTLTAVPGAWGPAPVTLKYQWKANGIAITAATASTYKPVAAVIGKTLSVTVTGSKAGYTTVTKASAITARVAVGTLSAPVPVISGALRVGSVLTATGAWGPAPVTLKYQWKANGVAITGATASTYTPTTAMLGKTLAVTVTGSKSGFSTVTKTSAVSVKVGVGVLTAPVPTISGTPTAGSILTAVPGAWGPAPVSLTYQWYANGMPISGEVKSTYTPLLPGYAISVSVTGTKSGFTSAEKTSAPTAPVT